eukprot:gnl/Carplike_NY0171/3247_a4374_521.p1 GENE.gnl/Carplike_NY0171/3247_a4374_521~~gnl/Carplike_NY0171/3247_a4374_521.p1  ORF type:complete len:145 (+),score=33.84 gnl/Carplike_NY0171/3247_a4374_521:92-526(+)
MSFSFPWSSSARSGVLFAVILSSSSSSSSSELKLRTRLASIFLPSPFITRLVIVSRDSSSSSFSSLSLDSFSSFSTPSFLSSSSSSSFFSFFSSELRKILEEGESPFFSLLPKEFSFWIPIRIRPHHSFFPSDEVVPQELTCPR